MENNSFQTGNQNPLSRLGGRVTTAFNAALGSKNSQRATEYDDIQVKQSGNAVLDRVRFAFQSVLGNKAK